MAKEQRAKIKIEDLPRPEEELTSEQAEKLTGGAFSTGSSLGSRCKTDAAKDETGTATNVWDPEPDWNEDK